MTTHHTIETHAKVYLTLDESGDWFVDPVTCDGYPLDGLDDGPFHAPADCAVEDCSFIGNPEVLFGWKTLDTPTAEELFVLLGRALGKEGF